MTPGVETGVVVVTKRELKMAIRALTFFYIHLCTLLVRILINKRFYVVIRYLLL